MANLIRLRQKQQSPLKCKICDKEFKSNKGLKKHIDSVHNRQKEDNCDSCGKAFYQARDLKRHID